MRLIDAVKLKESIIDMKLSLSNKRQILHIIDNAPTITTSLKLENITKDDVEKFKMIWLRATSKGFPLISEDRPQGKWLPNYTSQFINPGRQCSLCGKIVEFSENFCPNCGTDMRGDKE